MIAKRDWIATGLVLGAVSAFSGAASAYQVEAVSNGGAITGKISFKGATPEPKSFKVEKTPEVCGEADRLLVEVAVNDGHLKGAVVVLEGVEKGKPYAARVDNGDAPGNGEFRIAAGDEFAGLEVSPKDCNFGPSVGILQKDKAFKFVNRDPVKHSPHTYEVKGRVRKTIHNVDLEGEGTLDLVAELKKSPILKLECDQHNFMQNFFYAVENPYYDISQQDGSFTIDQVPPGSYKLTIWHPVLGEQKQEVTVAAGGKAEVSVEFVAK